MAMHLIALVDRLQMRGDPDLLLRKLRLTLMRKERMVLAALCLLLPLSVPFRLDILVQLSPRL
jgi:hypothetical protein